MLVTLEGRLIPLPSEPVPESSGALPLATSEMSAERVGGRGGEAAPMADNGFIVAADDGCAVSVTVNGSLLLSMLSICSEDRSV